MKKSPLVESIYNKLVNERVTDVVYHGTGLIELRQILEQDIYNENVFTNLNNRFDIIFLDPPYKCNEISKIILNIKTNQLLNNNGLIILHRHKNNRDIYPSNFKVIEEKKYGISKIIFLSTSS